MEKLYEAIETIANHCKKTCCSKCVFKYMSECPGGWMAPDTTSSRAYEEHINKLL